MTASAPVADRVDTRLEAAPAALPRRTFVARIPGWVLSIVGVLAFIALWQTVAALRIWDPIFVPLPATVLSKFVETTGIHDGIVGYEGHLLWEHLWVTLQRILLSSVIAILVGIPSGLALGLIPALNHIFGPWITFLRQLPPLAYFSLLIIWFGIDDTPKIVLLVIAAVPPIIVATTAGLESINRDFVNAARSLGASKIQLVRTVLLPGALPDIFTGIRLGVGVAYTSVVAAETVNGLPGLGGMIRDAQRYNQTAVVILGIVILGITGLVIEFLLGRLQRRVTPWRGRT